MYQKVINVWLFILYIIAQVILWFVYQGDFSVLAKSSDVFVILATIRSAINVSDLNALANTFINHFDNYLVESIYRQFKRRYIRKLDSVYLRHIETVVLVIISLVFQFL
jgi:hypothetical protein